MKIITDKFIIDDEVQLQFYTRFAIYNLDELVVARQGGLAEFTKGGLMIKYEVFKPEKVQYVIMSDLYIIVYS